MLRKKQLILACCILATGCYLLLKGKDEINKKKRYSRGDRNKKRLANRKRAARNHVDLDTTSDEEGLDNNSQAAKRPSRGRTFKVSAAPSTTTARESESLDEFDVLAEHELKVEEHQYVEQDPFADEELVIKEELAEINDTLDEQELKGLIKLETALMSDD